jgi:phage gp46-like protein
MKHHANLLEYHSGIVDPCGCSLVLTRDQYHWWQHYDGAESMGTLRWHRIRCGDWVSCVCKLEESFAAQKINPIIGEGMAQVVDIHFHNLLFNKKTSRPKP